MSDSEICWKPRIEEPSKPSPSLKASSSRALTDSVMCCQVPGTSVNLRSIMRTPRASHMPSTAAALGSLLPACCSIVSGSSPITRSRIAVCWGVTDMDRSILPRDESIRLQTSGRPNAIVMTRRPKGITGWRKRAGDLSTPGQTPALGRREGARFHAPGVRVHVGDFRRGRDLDPELALYRGARDEHRPGLAGEAGGEDEVDRVRPGLERGDAPAEGPDVSGCERAERPGVDISRPGAAGPAYLHALHRRLGDRPRTAIDRPPGALVGGQFGEVFGVFERVERDRHVRDRLRADVADRQHHPRRTRDRLVGREARAYQLHREVTFGFVRVLACRAAASAGEQRAAEQERRCARCTSCAVDTAQRHPQSSPPPPHGGPRYQRHWRAVTASGGGGGGVAGGARGTHGVEFARPPNATRGGAGGDGS